MSLRAPRTEFAVGLFLLLALATVLVLAMASTNGKFGFGQSSGYPLKARFTGIGQLRDNAPVRIGGVTVGRVSSIQLDPQRFDAVVTLQMQPEYKDLPGDTTAGIFTSGLLGEAYIGLQPGGDPTPLKPGDEIVMTQSAVDLLQLASKYMFSSNAPKSDADATESADGSASAPSDGNEK
ncbi:outer membrane lipid asymmetry maintenance protein MlaD [Lysobacter sp. HDW10]|uniref:outer membrane lipid asymmetry maintenance protein MlaD n=1 Tax=Lysobacter sp. HDW10 TaxID=2714936 RepID=UPI00140BA15C|nr:outer membrane lipid asymmetry maintenance protein MlaD [Lysobacter sp. HDW10]QIK80800.1 outer membrane lipid asymmetry maintenance protein MlaD [Lysobacter sp. HDW10]